MTINSISLILFRFLLTVQRREKKYDDVKQKRKLIYTHTHVSTKSENARSIMTTCIFFILTRRQHADEMAQKNMRMR